MDPSSSSPSNQHTRSGAVWRNKGYNWRRLPPIKPLDEVVSEFAIPRRTLQRWLGTGKLTRYKVEGDRRRYLDVAEVKRLRQPKALP